MYFFFVLIYIYFFCFLDFLFGANRLCHFLFLSGYTLVHYVWCVLFKGKTFTTLVLDLLHFKLHINRLLEFVRGIFWSTDYLIHRTLAISWHHHLFHHVRHPVSVQSVKCLVILWPSLVIVIERAVYLWLWRRDLMSLKHGSTFWVAWSFIS